MDRCPNCGNKLSSIDVLCPKCGAVVEVVQVKNSAPPKQTDAVIEYPAAETEKREFPRSFVVYNEDFPAEEESLEGNFSEEETPAIQSESPFEAKGPDKQSFAAAESADEDAFVSPEGFRKSSIYEQLAQYEASIQEKEVYEDNIPKYAEEPAAPDEEYSQRYVDNLKNMQLPEIDDISNFDSEELPEEPEKEYEDTYKPASQDFELEVSERHWLEIEELSDAKQPEESIVVRSANPPAEVTERRYKGTAKENEQTRRALNPRHENKAKAANNIRPRQEEKVKAVREHKAASKKTSALLAALLWVILAGVFFFSFTFFDKYVKTAYGDYGSFVYSITDGKVDLGTGGNQ